jgi:hypothetical protein
MSFAGNPCRQNLSAEFIYLEVFRPVNEPIDRNGRTRYRNGEINSKFSGGDESAGFRQQ